MRIFLLLILAWPAAAFGDVSQTQDSPSELPSGGIMAIRDGVKLAPFVLERTDVKAEIAGAFAHVEVSQRYVNPHPERLEAVYVFPLPDNAAVTDMYMRIGDRVVASEVRERGEAKKVYEAAKSSGHAAALLEQERPNIFTQSLANLEPGSTVFIHIKYVHEVSYDAGRFQFVFPMVVGPRFIPGTPSASTNKGRGWANDTDRVPDASRITPHHLLPGERSGHDISVRVELRPGRPAKGIRSVSHRLKLSGSEEPVIELDTFDTIPNKDFILEWKVPGAQPEIAALAHSNSTAGYVMLLLQPQPAPSPKDVTAKEMVFVVDTSGSMSGEPIAKVKAVMRRAITGMNTGDSFQIIRFDQRASSFKPGPVAFTPENVRDALSYINDFNGGGGTNMIEGIKAALDYPRDPSRRRIVLFMTDGYIGNETEILAEIKARLGESRLFSFGVGSSVNRYLLDRMAVVGLGFVQYARPDEDTSRAVELFYKRVRNPLLMDVSVDWGGLPVTDVTPAQTPDLFDSQPLYVFARYSGPSSGTVTVRGKVAGRPYARRLTLKLNAVEPANKQLASVWARRQIEAFMAEQYRGERPEIVDRVKSLGLAHKLMTKYTSFVAVERRLKADTNIPLSTVLIASEMPEGVSFQGVFGRDAAVVSIPRMKPGDPVLTVAAPPNTAAVIADFPFGRRQLCRWDARREKFACRFLVPRAVADGAYDIKILCVGLEGSKTRMVARYVVDSKAPVLEIEAARENGALVLRAKPKENVLEASPRPNGSVRISHDIKRVTALVGGKRIALKLAKRPGEFIWIAKLPKGSREAIIEAVDFAGNVRRQRVALP